MIYESIEEWKKEACKRFGDDELEWAFVCPACGNVAKVKDFAQYKDNGATPDSAPQNCIGRYTGGRKGPHKCDWAAYGLFRGPNIIKDKETEVPIFDFASII